MAAEKLYSKIRFFPDGIGVGSTTMRLSNIPKNLSSQATYAAGAVVAAYNFLTNSMVNASSTETEYSSEYLCPGDRKTFHFEAPNGTPYRVSVVDTDPVYQNILEEIKKSGGSIRPLPSTLTQLLFERLQLLPNFCQGNITTDHNSTYSGVEYRIPSPFANMTCNISAFSYPENLPRDSVFEACLTKSLETVSGVWNIGWVMQAFKHPWASSSGSSISPIALTIPATIFFTTAALGVGCYFFNKRQEKKALSQPNAHVNKQKLEAIGFDYQNIPQEFICPFTREIMDDPYSIEDGTNCEKVEIEKWLFLYRRPIHPRTNLPLTNTTLTPNSELKKRIEDFVKSKEEEHRTTASASTSRLGSNNNN